MTVPPLSECIRLGAMLKPQGFTGGYLDRTCAMFAALEAVGSRANYPAYLSIWPILTEPTLCPVCGDYGRVSIIIALHLNDFHCWTRERIADWVQTIEPPIEPLPAPPAGVRVEEEVSA